MIRGAVVVLVTGPIGGRKKVSEILSSKDLSNMLAAKEQREFSEMA